MANRSVRLRDTADSKQLTLVGGDNCLITTTWCLYWDVGSLEGEGGFYHTVFLTHCLPLCKFPPPPKKSLPTILHGCQIFSQEDWLLILSIISLWWMASRSRSLSSPLSHSTTGRQAVCASHNKGEKVLKASTVNLNPHLLQQQQQQQLFCAIYLTSSQLHRWLHASHSY